MGFSGMEKLIFLHCNRLKTKHLLLFGSWLVTIFLYVAHNQKCLATPVVEIVSSTASHCPISRLPGSFIFTMKKVFYLSLTVWYDYLSYVFVCVCVEKAEVCLFQGVTVLGPGQSLVQYFEGVEDLCYTVHCLHHKDPDSGFYAMEITSINCSQKCGPVRIQHI